MTCPPLLENELPDMPWEQFLASLCFDRSGKLDQLGDLTNKEALSKYPTEEEMRDQYRESAFGKIYNEISNLVYTRQDKS